MQGIIHFIKCLLTEDDANSIWCPVRVIGASGIVTLIGLAIYTAVTKGQFDPMSFGTGVAGIAGATGAGAGIKAKMGA
jgi:hypothetical protein